MALFFMFFLGMESLAFARAGGGRSSGSRGFRSGTRPSMSQPTRPVQQPGTPQQGQVQQPGAPGMGRSFLSGLGGGILGGMIGSMLFGGRAGAAGTGSSGFGFGDFILILIILGIIYFVIKRFRTRRGMQMSTAGPAYSSYRPDEYTPSPTSSVSAPTHRGNMIMEGLRHIGETDPGFTEKKFKETAEDNFFRIQSAWTRRDLGPVKHLLTPRMYNTFQEEVNRYSANKQYNRLENIAVRSIDIVDAVQDQGEEYVTVKFLASLLDYIVDESTGQAVSGSTQDPVKFLEYWTFTRKVGESDWLLAGITQEGDYQ